MYALPGHLIITAFCASRIYSRFANLIKWNVKLDDIHIYVEYLDIYDFFLLICKMGHFDSSENDFW
jgi:hypothetical protein